MPAGTYVVEAVYSGDATHLGSTSAPITVTTDPLTHSQRFSSHCDHRRARRYAELGVIISSVGGFTDTIRLGCSRSRRGELPLLHPSVQLSANGNATAQLTIDTNSPLTGGSMAMSGRAGGANARRP